MVQDTGPGSDRSAYCLHGIRGAATPGPIRSLSHMQTTAIASASHRALLMDVQCTRRTTASVEQSFRMSSTSRYHPAFAPASAAECLEARRAPGISRQWVHIVPAAVVKANACLPSFIDWICWAVTSADMQEIYARKSALPDADDVSCICIATSLN